MNRTYCGQVNQKMVNQEVLIKGWIKKNRKLGKLIFLDVGDRSGIVQVIVDSENINYQAIKELPRESVIEINGIVNLRTNINHQLANGDVEIKLTNIKIDSISKTPPLIIENNTDALEETRMNYRYLDLRRPIIQQNLFFRSKLINLMQNYLIENGFINVETPILAKPTPEGARDYLVPSRVNKGSFYALPQSPQIYKQLLMVAGFDRYFQIARCFRDEDLRSDRQPEFTQLDIEMSFINEIDIQIIIEDMFKFLFKQALNIELKTPFLKMDYETAMNKYGCDKPDLRFGLELNDYSTYFQNSKFNLFKQAIDQGKVIKAIVVDNLLTKAQIKTLDKFAKDMNANELMWINVENKSIIDGSFSKYIEESLILNIINQHGLSTGTLLFVCDKLNIANNALGIVRNQLATILDLKKPNDFKFLWIVNWPLFEYNDEEKKYLPAHHPFTQPQDEYHTSFDKDMANAKAKAYDIVLNGYEIGGGSIRITDSAMQKRMFDAIGLNEEQINNKFGYLIDAFNYGVPPHGGIALGLDRIVAILTNQNNIKDCIAFPKNTSACDVLFKTPNPVDEVNLNELGIKIGCK